MNDEAVFVTLYLCCTIAALHFDLSCLATTFILSFLFLGYLLKLKRFPKEKASNPSETPISENFSLSIVDVRFNETKQVVEYLLHGRYNSFVWTSWKRYSSFRKLKGFLASSCFPKRSSLGQWATGNETDIRFVTKRRALLNTFFAEAITKEFFENNLTDTVREEVFGVPADSLPLQKKALSSPQEVVAEVALALKLAEECVSVAKAGGNGQKGWNLFGKSKDETVSGFIKEEGVLTFAMSRGAISRFPKDQVVSFLLNDNLRKEWDEGFKFEVKLEEFDTKLLTLDGFELLDLKIVRTGTNSPAKAFVSERDSVCAVASVKRISDGAFFLCFRSVLHPSAPEGLEGYIRAKVMCGCFVVEESDKGCVLTSVGMFDPVGKIPKWVINLALKNNTWQPWSFINSQRSLS